MLSPPRDWQVTARPRNNDSLVLRIHYRNSAALLPADAEKKIERALLESAPRAELLKVGNGSLTSSTPEFLDAVRPDVSVISARVTDREPGPSPEVLSCFAGLGSRVLVTDSEGAVTVQTDGKKLSVSTYAERALRPAESWREEMGNYRKVFQE